MLGCHTTNVTREWRDYLSQGCFRGLRRAATHWPVRKGRSPDTQRCAACNQVRGSCRRSKSQDQRNRPPSLEFHTSQLGPTFALIGSDAAASLPSTDAGSGESAAAVLRATCSGLDAPNTTLVTFG